MVDNSIETIIERLNVLKKHYNWSDNYMSNGDTFAQNAINCQLSSVEPLSIDALLKVINACPEVSAEWLLRGKGQMLLKDNVDISIKNVKDSFSTNFNDNLTISKLLDLLAEKDKQISYLIMHNNP